MDIDRFTELTKGSELSKLPTETSSQLAKISFLRQFNRGEYIFTPGNTADWIGFITSGVAREYATDPRGQEEVWDLLCEGDYCTLAQPFFEKAPSICGIQALEDMELVVVTRKDLFWLFESIPELQAFTYELLSNRMLERMQQRSRLLNMTALERYKFFMRKHPNLLSRVALGHVSSYLGIRQSSLSRIRKSLRESVRGMA